jgi:SAM-dependent methyltransferase
MKNQYVHGYSPKEAERLNDQANTLDELLHHDSVWEDESLILEAGCGVGAQTKIIAPKNPKSNFISVDISSESLAGAKNVMQELEIQNVQLQQADIFSLPFSNDIFDHVFVCFVLEHLAAPEKALQELKRVLKHGGSIMVIEGDHGSAYYYPESKFARKAIQCQVTLQRLKGGNANIGRSLYPLLLDCGFSHVEVSPRMVYVDDSKPALVDGFTRKTFTAMIEGIADDAVNQGLISKEEMKQGILDLYNTAAGEGTFCYTFFKARGIKE